MASGKTRKPSKPSSSFKNPKSKLKPKQKIDKKKKKHQNDTKAAQNDDIKTDEHVQPIVSASQQLAFFLEQLQSAKGVQLSSLELESISDKCMVELSLKLEQDASNLGEHLKVAFGKRWKEMLCEKKLVEGEFDAGSPAVLVFSASALRSLELLRGLRALTKDCHAAKLFSKHMKVEEQVSLLKDRVNIASGTPSRIKKLIDMEALGLSRLDVIVLDMQPDVKGYSLFSLPQVRDEFWDLYKNYFHPRFLQGDLRICLYGPINRGPGKRKAKKDVCDNS